MGKRKISQSINQSIFYFMSVHIEVILEANVRSINQSINIYFMSVHIEVILEANVRSINQPINILFYVCSHQGDIRPKKTTTYNYYLY